MAARTLACALVLALLGLAWGQAIGASREAGILYLALDELSARLGYSTSEGGASFVARTPGGILTVFAGESEVLWSAPGQGEAELSLAAPVVQREGRWWVPQDLLATLELTVTGEAVTTRGGRRIPLEFGERRPAAAETALVELGGGVTGLAFYAPGAAGPDTLSLLVLDAGLLALVRPEAQAALDAAEARFGEAHALYFVVTALAEASWTPQFVLEQGSARLELSYPFAVSLFAGDPARVTPEAPVSGVIVLPPSVNLRAPLTLAWQGLSGEVRFRY